MGLFFMIDVNDRFHEQHRLPGQVHPVALHLALKFTTPTKDLPF